MARVGFAIAEHNLDLPLDIRGDIDPRERTRVVASDKDATSAVIDNIRGGRV